MKYQYLEEQNRLVPIVPIRLKGNIEEITFNEKEKYVKFIDNS